MNQIKIGCCGFAKGMKEYFSRFRLVEVQQTFYKPPAINTALNWRHQAPPQFEFTVKAWQLITHPVSSPTYRRAGLEIPEAKAKYYGFFQPTDEVLEAWEKTRDIANALQAKIILFQCPARFTDCPENAEKMRLFFNRLDREAFIFVWEPRGKWNDKSVIALCNDLGLVHCVDPLDKAPLYGRIKYFRLHGGPRYRHRYSDEELKQISEMSIGQTYILFNNLNMFEDACRLVDLVRKR